MIRRQAAGRTFAVALALAALTATGCVNSMVMLGRVLTGDPMIPSAFEQRTGVDLAETQQRVVLICTAPASITDRFDTVQLELQDEVTRQMRQRGLNVAKPDDVASVMEETVGFDRDALAEALPDVDYIFHVDIEQLSHTEPASPNLYRGRANGMIYGYEVHRDESGGRPTVLQIFFQEFSTEYPSTHPIPADQVTDRTFATDFVEHLSSTIGQAVYDVPTTDLVR